ncbi:MAG: hypothetical protein U1A72_08680 [Sulfuritalea sp.]|nr:hypothetical protein [Sulfuritalea sp.]
MDVRLQAFEETLEGLTYLVNVDLAAMASTLDPRLIDGLRNGQAQNLNTPWNSPGRPSRIFSSNRKA